MNIALITGASSGIGKEFITQLAKENDIDEFWVIARRKERLDELQKEVKQKVYSIALDLCDANSFEVLENTLKKRNPNIKVLVCAAGLGKVGDIMELSLESQERMLSLNCHAAISITKLSLPHMKEDSRIIEIGSIAGFGPMPHFAIYSATKAFLESYTKSLHYELKKKGIHVTLVCPYWVKDTEFIAGSSTSNQTYYRNYFLATTKDKVVKKALLASQKNKWVCTPDIVSTIDRIFVKLIPHALYIRVMDIVAKM